MTMLFNCLSDIYVLYMAKSRISGRTWGTSEATGRREYKTNAADSIYNLIEISINFMIRKYKNDK